MELKTPPKIHAYAYHICRAWYNGLYTVATKPIKFLGLHYTMTPFIIKTYILNKKEGVLPKTEKSHRHACPGFSSMKYISLLIEMNWGPRTRKERFDLQTEVITLFLGLCHDFPKYISNIYIHLRQLERTRNLVVSNLPAISLCG